MNKIVIRRPEKKDICEIHNLFNLVIEDTFSREGFEELIEQMDGIFDEKTNYLKEDFASKGVERYFLIAEYENKIVGTIESGPSSKLLIESTNKTYENSIEIGTVFVLPEHQQLGIGSLLLKAMCKKLASENIKEICIQSGYKIAGAVWRKKFGKPTFIVDEYWGEDYDHLVWCNQLSRVGDIIVNDG